ncbi:MAG: hypothetical protein H7Y22_18215 [Gemmatimonadaceae bacterium]|nr:hypothetical protein [Gloeobacterales cyanobacterium ES-bin-141]
MSAISQDRVAGREFILLTKKIYGQPGANHADASENTSAENRLVKALGKLQKNRLGLDANPARF